MAGLAEGAKGRHDGDSTWDTGVFRPSAALWSIRDLTRVDFGGASDAPVTADFNGDGRDDIGIFRDIAGMWALRDLSRVYFGTAGDVPVAR